MPGVPTVFDVTGPAVVCALDGCCDLELTNTMTTSMSPSPIHNGSGIFFNTSMLWPCLVVSLTHICQVRTKRILSQCFIIQTVRTSHACCRQCDWSSCSFYRRICSCDVVSLRRNQSQIRRNRIVSITAVFHLTNCGERTTIDIRRSPQYVILLSWFLLKLQ